MTVRLAVGIVVFVAGAAIWYFTRQRAAVVADSRAPAASLPRIGLAMAALGLSVLASTQPGLGWSVSSICYSLFAIVILVRVVRDSLRR